MSVGIQDLQPAAHQPQHEAVLQLDAERRRRRPSSWNSEIATRARAAGPGPPRRAMRHDE